jgi:hypothetical protein
LGARNSLRCGDSAIGGCYCGGGVSANQTSTGGGNVVVVAGVSRCTTRSHVDISSGSETRAVSVVVVRSVLLRAIVGVDCGDVDVVGIRGVETIDQIQSGAKVTQTYTHGHLQVLLIRTGTPWRDQTKSASWSSTKGDQYILQKCDHWLL